MTTLTNLNAARVLFTVAAILELAEDNPYRVRAYRRAARLVLRDSNDAKIRLTADGQLDLPGLGPHLRRKLGELLKTGRMRLHIDQCAEPPESVATLMRIPGIGPKTALRLNEELGLESAQDVYAAAQAGRIKRLYGFSERRERRLLTGAEAALAGHFKPDALPVENDTNTLSPLLPFVPRDQRLPLPDAA